MSEIQPPVRHAADIVETATEISRGSTSRKRRIAEKFLVAAIGSIPWIGGFLSAMATLKEEEQSDRLDSLQSQWLESHQAKIEDLGATLGEIEDRFEKLGPEINERIESDEYLSLVRQAFRTWDEANTEEKRRLIANLITNAAGTRLCSDDVLRLFLEWLDLYHEVHFGVMRVLFQNPGATRYEIWTSLYGDELPREDSAEADLFKLMIRDLSTGGVLRQARDTNEFGQFLRKTPQRRRKGTAPTTMESAFEDTKPHVLTELGKQFVHYTMNEVVSRVTSGST